MEEERGPRGAMTKDFIEIASSEISLNAAGSEGNTPLTYSPQ